MATITKINSTEAAAVIPTRNTTAMQACRERAMLKYFQRKLASNSYRKDSSRQRAKIWVKALQDRLAVVAKEEVVATVQVTPLYGI